MPRLSYVSLNLYYYFIKYGLHLDEERQNKTYQKLLKALPKHLETTIKASFADDEKKKFVDFKNDTGTDGTEIDLKFSGNLNGRQIEVLYRRSVLDDSYAILFDSYFTTEIELKEAPKLIKHDLRASIPPDEKLYWKNHFAHTWMVTACGAIFSDQQVTEIAKEVYKPLTNKSVDWNQQNMSELEGITIYEYWQSLPNPYDHIEPNSHLLIIIYQNEETMKSKRMDNFRELLQGLLYHRNKIIWAYNNSPILKKRLLTKYNESMAFRDLDHLSFKELKSLMTKLWEFNSNFNTLKIQKDTIETNLHNYDKYVEDINKTLPGMVTSISWLDNLEKFGQYARKNYPEQITKDVKTLEKSLEILERLKAPSKEILEIKVAENTHNFQKLISVISFGFSAASATAVGVQEDFLKQLQGKLEPSCKYQLQPPKYTPKDSICLAPPDPLFLSINKITGSPSWSLIIIAVALCLGVGVFFSLIAAIFLVNREK